MLHEAVPALFDSTAPLRVAIAANAAADQHHGPKALPQLAKISETEILDSKYEFNCYSDTMEVMSLNGFIVLDPKSFHLQKLLF